MVTTLVLLAILPVCFTAPSGHGWNGQHGGYYGQKHAEPHDGFESSVHANNARRQLAVNKNAQWYGTGTGTARKDGVPGSPLGVIGVRSHGHQNSYGHGHAAASYGGHNDGYGNAGYGGHHNNRFGNSYISAPSYQPYSQHGSHGSHGSHGHNHPSHYDPHGNVPRGDGPKYDYGFSYELNKRSH